MPARKPEECDLLLIEAINKGDLDAAVALYEPKATFVLDSGEVITGQGAIREALRQANGNKSQAARLLGLSRNALRYRLSKIGIADEGEKEA